jgi:hypothetical protein
LSFALLVYAFIDSMALMYCSLHIVYMHRKTDFRNTSRDYSRFYSGPDSALHVDSDSSYVQCLVFAEA